MKCPSLGVVACLLLSSCMCAERLVPDPALGSSVSSLDFGTVGARGTSDRTVTLRNEGGRSATLALELVDGSREGAFLITSAPSMLGPGESGTIELRYLGAAVLSADVAALVVDEAGSSAELRISLAGRTLPGAEEDAGADAGLDAGSDAGLDPGSDAGLDAGTDAGRDAGVDGGPDAAIDLPVFDGGGPCGNANVLELPFLVGPPPNNALRNTPSIVAVEGDFALTWQESLPDAGIGLYFTRLAPSGRAVVAPRVIHIGGERSVRMAFNGRELALAQSLPDPGAAAGMPHEFVEFVRLDPHGTVIDGGVISLGSFYRPGLTAESVGWNPVEGEWALAWGWWGSSASSSLQRISAQGALLGTRQSFSPSEVPWRSTPLAGADGGSVMVDLRGSLGAARLRRLAADGGELFSVDLASSVNGGIGMKPVAGNTTWAVAWRRFINNTNIVEFVVVDANGALVPGSFRTVVAQNAGYFDLAWNGASYTLLETALVGSTWVLTEHRFSETGQPVGTARQLTCAGNISDVSLGFASGVHLATFQDSTSGDTRLLIFP